MVFRSLSDGPLSFAIIRPLTFQLCSREGTNAARAGSGSALFAGRARFLGLLGARRGVAM